MLKTSVVCAALLSVAVFGLASIGGGKKRTAIPTPVFTPLRSTGTFTLKIRPDYSGSQGFSRINDQDLNDQGSVLYKSVITYQKGNSIYVLPSSYRISAPRLSLRSNLNVIDLKIRFKK